MGGIDLSAAFGLAPEAAIEYFRQKGYAITWDWRELWKEAHARAFTVAKVMRTDILQDIRQALDDSLANGTTYADFEKKLTPTLQAKGWWGKTEHINTLTGEAGTAQLGSTGRLKTIFQTNTQTAYMAGRYQQMMESADSHPWWQYVSILDGRTRPMHRAMNGRVFRYDDPVWDFIYPPNGFNCRCRVRPLTDGAIKRAGITPQRSAGKLVDHEIRMADGTRVTVKALRVNVDGREKLFAPDVGWDYNPGKAWARWDRAGGIPDCYGDAANFAEGDGCLPILSARSYKDLGRPNLRDVPPALRTVPPRMLKEAATRELAVDVLADAIGISRTQPLRVVATPIEQVAIRYEFLPHLVEKESDARERYANFILPTLENPYEIWLSEYLDGYRRRYIGLFDRVPNLLVVVRINKDGSLLWNIMQADDKAMNKQRRGGMLYGK